MQDMPKLNDLKFQIASCNEESKIDLRKVAKIRS